MEMPFAYFAQTSQPRCVALHKVNGLPCAFHNSWQNAGGKAGQGLGFCSPPCCFPKANLGYDLYFTAQLVMHTCPEARKAQCVPGLLTLSPGSEAGSPLPGRGHKPGLIPVELSCTQGT